MPSFLARLFATSAPARPEQTKTIAPALFALHALAQPRWTLRNGAELIREGYERNAVVYRCVRMIAENAACVPWLVYAGETEAPHHPLARLIAQPNAQEAWPAFLEGVFSDLMLFGDSYVQATLIYGAPRALYRLRPDRMSVVAAVNGWPRAYEYRVGGEVTRYSMEQGGQAPILHLRCFHPLDDHYGLAPLAAAQTPLDVHNAADAWCKALLDNSARPSGALVYAGSAGALTEEQFTRLKSELDENFSGARNAGRPLLLEGGLDWKPLSLSPKDMDFARAKHDAAREIALAFGVPPLLLGLPGDNTHANFRRPTAPSGARPSSPSCAARRRVSKPGSRRASRKRGSRLISTGSTPSPASAKANGAAWAPPPSSATTRNAPRSAMARSCASMRPISQGMNRRWTLTGAGDSNEDG